MDASMLPICVLSASPIYFDLSAFQFCWRFPRNFDICFCFLQAISFSNLYAPEHLIINVKDAEQWEELIENAGRHIFIISFGVLTLILQMLPLCTSISNSRSEYLVSIFQGQFFWDNGPQRAWVTMQVEQTMSFQPMVTRGCTVVYHWTLSSNTLLSNP